MDLSAAARISERFVEEAGCSVGTAYVGWRVRVTATAQWVDHFDTEVIITERPSKAINEDVERPTLPFEDQTALGSIEIVVAGNF